MNALVTRCPTCGTAFRVQPGQLSARSGMVRCGKCQAVFDGVAHLVANEAAPESPEPSPQLGLFEGARAPEPGRRPAPRASAPEDDEPLPEFLEEPPPRPRYAALWGLLAFVAAAALAGQVVYHYRTELATLAPQARPLLVEACAIIGCEVRLPRRPDLLSIESSDLQADERRDDLFVLHAVIRNRAAFAQELPALELTLTDAEEQALARRVLRPEDYLPGRERGLAPGAEAVLRVYLDTGGLRATGYRLYLFYPA